MLKRPLLQQKFTLAVPNEAEAAVTIEVIVLAPTTGDLTQATFEDYPKLREAGWIRHSVSDLDVNVRIIGQSHENTKTQSG